MTKTLHVTVNGKTATVSRRQGPIVGSNDDYRAVFTFSPEWAQIPDKMARFIFNGTCYDKDIEVGANGEYVAEVPRFQGGPGLVKIGVYSPSILTQRTTTAASVPVVPSVLDEGSGSGDEPGRGIPALTSRQISTIERLLRFAAYTKDATEEYYDFLNAFGLVVFSINTHMITLTAGDTQTLTATFSPPIDVPAEIVWTSSDPTIATVQDGVVTAVADGSCVITASCGAYSCDCSVQVGQFQLLLALISTDLVQGKIQGVHDAAGYASSGIPYLATGTAAAAKRLTYPNFFTSGFGPGFSYLIEYETSCENKVEVGIEVYNELAMQSVNDEEDIPAGNMEDLDWQSSGFVFTPSQTYNGYPPKGLRFTFRKRNADDTADIDINVGDVTAVRIYQGRIQ